MPAIDLRAARLEEARRELQRRAVSRARQTPFQDWLGEVTPAYTWDWDHLVFIQQQLARVSSGDITKLMLFVPPRHGKCLAAGTPVLLADGREIPIEHVQPGDQVITLDSERNTTCRRVVNIFDNGEKPVLRITLQSGRVVDCTENHPLLTIHGWTEAGALQIGDSIGAYRKLPIPVAPALPFGFAALMGYLIGDGSYGKGDTRVTTAEPAIVAHLEQIAGAHGWAIHRDGDYAYHIRKPSRFGKGDGSSARERMRQYMTPAKSRDKRVPAIIFQSNYDDLVDFLAAYFNCDGTVNVARDGTAEYYSTSEGLLRDVQQLLIRLGIYSVLQPKRGRYRGQVHESYRLIISGQDLVAFAQMVPVIGARGEKLRVIAGRVAAHNHYPEYDAIPNDWQKYLIRSKSWHRFHTGVRVDKQYKRGTARHLVLAVANAEDNAYLRSLCNLDIIWERIVKIEAIGNKPTYDIEVEDTHNFSTNGIIVHNSEMTTIRYPVYRMEMNPKLRVILGCYNQDLANKFSRDARKIARGRGIVGGGVCKQDEWEIKGGGSYRAAGVGGGVTGRGADLLIIDDPVRSRDDANSEAFRERVWDWYTNDMRTRLEPGGAIILIQTRWHEDDLAGRILKSADGPNWTVVSLPAEAEEDDPLGREVGAALCPERFDIAALADLKSVLGLDYYALYQQRPVAQEGGLYKRNWFTYCDSEETPAEFDYIVQSWDTASSRLGDYSVCATVGVAGNSAYILDVFRARLETPDLLTAVQDQYAAYFPRSVHIEDASNGTSVIQMLKRETRLPILAVAPHKGGKVSHANANLPYVEGGRVIFVRGAYLADFERELLAFPNGSHDDQVDALNIALTRIFGRLAQRASSHDGSGRNAALEKAGIHVAGEQPWTPPEPRPEPSDVKPTPFRRPPSKSRPITQTK